MVIENSVTVSGLLHFISKKKEHKYFPFSIRHENPWTDGTTRKDFLLARAFPEELQAKLKALTEGTPVKVEGVICLPAPSDPMPRMDLSCALTSAIRPHTRLLSGLSTIMAIAATIE